MRPPLSTPQTGPSASALPPIRVQVLPSPPRLGPGRRRSCRGWGARGARPEPSLESSRIKPGLGPRSAASGVCLSFLICQVRWRRQRPAAAARGQHEPDRGTTAKPGRTPRPPPALRPSQFSPLARQRRPRRPEAPGSNPASTRPNGPAGWPRASHPTPSETGEGSRGSAAPAPSRPCPRPCPPEQTPARGRAFAGARGRLLAHAPLRRPPAPPLRPRPGVPGNRIRAAPAAAPAAAMAGAAGPPQGPEEEEEGPAAATAPDPGPGGNKFADIRRLLAEGAFPPAFGSIRRKNLKRYAQKFVLEGGRLYYVGLKREEKREVVVDPERRRQVFLESHLTEAGPHLGQKKTVHGIQGRYYWLGIVKDVVDWIKMCPTCQNAEHTKNMVRKVRPVKAEAPWEILGLELHGPFPETARANSHILIVTDYFTKWIEAIPLRKKDALSVAKALAGLFYRFGASKNIYSSQNWAFCEEVSRHLGERWSISQTLTPSAAPDPTGLDEATAKLLKAALQSVVKEKQADWDEHLDPMVFSFRTTVSSVTKHTPFFLMFNRHVCLSSEVIGNSAASGKGERRNLKRRGRGLPALAFSVEDPGFADGPLKKLKKSPFVSFQFETILPSEEPPVTEGKQSPSAEH
ncbi:uncharacterized protein LOC141501494 isoform X2 [Macrotis lagotis]|uniref:uncharacterized protein LOC141501494 isoform X2 n=1 Tax=Macrotis lagotis TaxID=92651 RepID=UPI003D68A8A1